MSAIFLIRMPFFCRSEFIRIFNYSKCADANKFAPTAFSDSARTGVLDAGPVQRPGDFHFHRQALEANYASTIPDAEKFQRKAEIFEDLQHEYQTLKQSWDGYAGYDRWFAEPLSNAHLAAPAFAGIFFRHAKGCVE